jgi:hypothetical protein
LEARKEVDCLILGKGWRLRQIEQLVINTALKDGTDTMKKFTPAICYLTSLLNGLRPGSSRWFGSIPRQYLAGWPLFSPRQWLQYVNALETEAELNALRRSTVRGTPYGRPNWVARTAKQLRLESTLRKPGRHTWRLRWGWPPDAPCEIFEMNGESFRFRQSMKRNRRAASASR